MGATLNAIKAFQGKISPDNLREGLQMALLPHHQTTVEYWQNQGVLLAGHTQLLELWERDQSQGYPFFRDEDLAPKVQLHEYERFGLMNYAAQLRIERAYSLLKEIETLHCRYLEEVNQLFPRNVFIREDLSIAAFLAYLVSALEAVAGQIVLVYGLPINLKTTQWVSFVSLLSAMVPPYDSVATEEIPNHYPVMPVNNLRSIILTNGASPDWLKELIDYRNNYTPRTFFATILEKDGFYIPKQADILPSIVINPLESARYNNDQVEVARIKNTFFHPLPLHEYCHQMFDRIKGLIESIYPELIVTYQTRLDQPNRLVNPHSFYRLGII